MFNKKAFKNGVTLLMILSISLTGLAGCGKDSDEDFSKMSKNELIAEIEKTYADYDKLAAENNELYKTLNALKKSGTSTEAGINTSGTGDKTLYFNSYDSKMIFPETWEFPNSTEVSSEPVITLAKALSLKINGTWTVQMSNGSTLYMEDTSGISATINVAKMESNIPSMDTFQKEVMEPWFKGMDSVVYNDIFVNGSKLGMQAQTPISIDGNDAYLKAGMFLGSSYTVTYVCVYRGENNADKNTKINDLINSMTIAGSQITVNG